MKRHAMVLVTATVIAWSLGVQAQQNDAGAMTTEQKCQPVATLASTAATARDKHMSQEQLLATVEGQGPRYVDFYRRISGVAYAHPEWSPDVLYAAMLRTCMQQAGTEKPLVK